MAIVREKKSISRDKTGLKRVKSTLSKSAPNFDSMFEDVQNPLEDQAFEGGFEDSINGQMSATLKAAIDARKSLEERFRIADNPNFYFLACFQSVDQKEEFLIKIGMEHVKEDQFISGLELSSAVGVEVKVIEIPPLKLRGAGKLKRFKPSDIL